MKTTPRGFLCLRLAPIALIALFCGVTGAFEVPQRSLDEKEFFKPDLVLTSSNVPLGSLKDSLSNRSAWDRFFEKYGSAVQVYLDPRSGTPSSVMLSVPLLPGTGVGNHVRLEDVGQALGKGLERIDEGAVEGLMRKFLVGNREAFGLDTTELGPGRATQVTESLWQISIPQYVSGIPVRWGRVAATIQHGNLILVGTESWGNVQIDTKPGITPEQALAIGFAWAGGKSSTDTFWKKATLEILPFAPAEFKSGEGFAGPTGSGYGHRLVWAFGFYRDKFGPRWEAIVDARTGELLAVEDRNLYETKKIVGGAYPLTSTEICPTTDTCGVMQAGSPMPFADTGLASPDNFTNSAGLYNYPGTGSFTTTLNGKYVRIDDSCGVVSVSAAGDNDLGGVNGQHDCASGGGSAGNTAASRSAFYETNKLIEMARGWLPSNPWLQAQLPVNVNINLTCNAFWGGGSVNFYRSGGGCRNTGEIAAVFDHEWGHGLDDNDAAGILSTSSEAYADIAAIYRLQASCVGHGFKSTSDAGCGLTADGTGFNSNEALTGASHCDLDCSGVRDTDWDKHANHTPDTPQNFVCGSCTSGSGPCGRQTHCSAAPSRQAGWDLAARDLQAAPFSLNETDAFITASRIFFQGSGNIGSWHACTCPSTSDGCGATNAYMQWLAADDDNGNLADGTPHMTALFAAFNRHNIACPTPTPVNSGCAGAPTTAPSLTLTPASNQVGLAWTAVPGAVSYRVLRSEGYAGCDFGKTVIANVAGTSYIDPEVGNGRPYSYLVQAVGATSACFGPASACLSGTPLPCAGTVSLSQGVASCSDSLTVSLVDSDLAGAGSQIVTATSNTEPGGETLVLTETFPGSDAFTGTLVTSSVPAAGGDGLLSVSAGDDLGVTYTDVSFCGTPNVPTGRTISVDCVPPVITNVRAENVTGRNARIKWSTNEPANSAVTYGLAPPPASIAGPDASFVTSHDLLLSGLQECSTYSYAVTSADLAGNPASDDNGGAYRTFATGTNTTPAYTYAGPPVPIPDNTPAGASVSVSVPDTNTIVDVNVKVSLTHTWDGDISLLLIGPNATQVSLALQRGGSGDNFTDTVFDDEAATAIGNGTAPFTGSFRPDAALSAFDGQSAAGTWTFKVVDAFNNDAGDILAFELNLTYPPQACGSSVEYSSSSPTDTCATGGPGSANGITDPGETLTLPVTLRNNGTAVSTGIQATLASASPGVTVLTASANYPDLAPGATAVGATPFVVRIDPALTCGAAVDLQITAVGNEGSWVDTFSVATGSTGTTTGSQASTDVPKPIPDVRAPVLSIITVGGFGAVVDVNVGLTLTHTADVDLDITLIGPNGTRVELTSDNGGSGDNFTNTVFDDEAATSISSGTPPYTGSFRPEGLLSSLDGAAVAGTWTLEIIDDDGGDSGNLSAWSLTIVRTTAPTCASCSAPAAPLEVVTLQWDGSSNGLTWSAASGADLYNLYRGAEGDLAKLLDATADSCRRMTTASLATGPVLSEAPLADSFYWFLVRAENAGGEGPAGAASGGARILNAPGVCP